MRKGHGKHEPTANELGEFRIAAEIDGDVGVEQGRRATGFPQVFALLKCERLHDESTYRRDLQV